jgi:hypothetical protein
MLCMCKPLASRSLPAQYFFVPTAMPWRHNRRNGTPALALLRGGCG